jgi:hypothetical protein
MKCCLEFIIDGEKWYLNLLTPMLDGMELIKVRKIDPDVFDYYLKVKCIGGAEEIIKGNVTLLK